MSACDTHTHTHTHTHHEGQRPGQAIPTYTASHVRCSWACVSISDTPFIPALHAKSTYTYQSGVQPALCLDFHTHVPVRT